MDRRRILSPIFNNNWRNEWLFRGKIALEGRARGRNDSDTSARNSHFWSGVRGFKSGEIDRISSSDSTARNQSSSHNPDSSFNVSSNANANANPTNPSNPGTTSRPNTTSGSSAHLSTRIPSNASFIKRIGVCLQF